MAGVDVGTAYLTVVPSAKGFAGRLQSDLGGGMSAAGSKAGKTASGAFGSTFKSGIGTAAKAGALALAGGLAIGIGFVKSSIAEARESQKVGALTENVIRSTGGAAKVTAAQVGDLATAISNKTGIDDEAIQSGANMLLTFKNIRNETGKGNDIFNQSTSILTDLATAMGSDPQKAAIQLGKALNDPIKGVAALGRVGVTFDDQQKKTIRSLVEGGKTAEAQKIILKELSSEFGGAAEATATNGEKMATAFGNFKEGIGTSLLPTLDKAESFLTTKLLPGIQGVIDILFKGDFTSGFAKAFNISEDSKIVDFLFNVREGAQQLFNLIFKGNVTGGPFAADGVVVTGVLALREAFFKGKDAVTQFVGEFAAGEGAGGRFRDVLTTVGTVVVAVGGFLLAHGAAVQVVVGAVLAGVAAFKVITAVVRAYTAVQAALNFVLTANPIGIVIVAVAALAAGLVIAYKKSETFRNIVNRAFDLIKTGALQMAYGVVAGTRFIVDAFLSMVSALVTGAAKAFGWVPGLGPKLKAAAANVEGFKTSANAALSKVERDLKIKADTSAAQAALNDLRRNASQSVTVPVFLSTRYTAGSVNVAGLGRQNAGNRASGGPVRAGSPYWVGENSDGSLNKTSELFVPSQSGTIMNQSQLASMSGGGSGSPVGGDVPLYATIKIGEREFATAVVRAQTYSQNRGGR